jgi:predicted RNase H-like HicB family nuclease
MKLSMMKNLNYGEIPELKGIWATGKTLEECRKRLSEVIEGRIIVRLKRGLPIPPIGGLKLGTGSHYLLNIDSVETIELRNGK